MGRFKRFAFIHIEKCGGSTLINMLRSSFGIRHFDIIAKGQQDDLAQKSDFEKVLKLCPSALSFSGHPIRLFHNKKIRQLKQVGFYTILRQPAARYISDFNHFAPCFPGVKNFRDWLKLEKRNNFMTRAIAGEPDFNKAVDIIRKEIALIGLLESFNEFVNQLRLLFYPELLTDRYKVRNKAGKHYEGFLYSIYEKMTKAGSRHDIDFKFDYDRYEDQIIKNNDIDTKLYNYVEKEILPAQREKFEKLEKNTAINRSQQAGQFNLMIKLVANQVFRNAVYKPNLGLFPGPYKIDLYKNV